MSSVTAVCPYCNSALPPLPAPAAARTPCPCCGEPLPNERFPVGDPDVAIAAGHPAPRPSDVQGADAPRSELAARKRKTLQVVLSIMAGMAAFALVFALCTQSKRRKLDPKPSTVIEVELARDPAQLLGLGYLPRGTNLVTGLHVAALFRTKAGVALVREPRPELVQSMLSTLDALGLKIADVDHVVLGMELPTLPPQTTTVVVMTKPYDPTQVRDALERQPCSESVFRRTPLFKLTKSKQVPKVWLADPRVLVYTTLTTEDLERIPVEKAGLLESLTPPVRKALRLRVAKQSLLWAVGDLEPAKGLADLALQFGLLPKDQGRLLTLIRGFAVGVTADEKQALTLTGHFHTADAKASTALEKVLQAMSIKNMKSQKIELPPADAKDADEQWVTWQVRGDAVAMRSALGLVRLLPWKGKLGTPKGAN